MRKKIITLILAMTCVALLPVAEAGTAKVKAKGQAEYGLFAGADVRQTAIEDAKKNAVRQYAAQFDSARFALFEEAFGLVEKNIDQYVLDYVLIDSGKNKETKNYEAYVEATINVNAIEKLVGQVAQETSAKGNGEAPYITLVLAGREPEVKKSFDDKETKIVQGVHSGESEESASDSGASFSEEETVKVIKGGSTESKADQIKYRCFSIGDADAAINEVFTKAGYEVVDPRDVDIDVYAFQEDYSAGADITPFSRKEANQKCKDLGISLLATGSMDVGLPSRDAVSGMQQVFVKVSIKVTDLRSRLPKTIASIRGVQYGGIGPTPEVARQNALNAAAQKSAADLVDQLRSKGVRVN
jgi:hypothetical protein